MKILMVCLGNICRSPLAHGILKSKVDQLHLDWEIDSAGTSSWHIGEQPDPRSIQIAQFNGIDITDQRGRQVAQSDLDYFDLIYVMDSSNYQDVRKLDIKNIHHSKIKLILNSVYPDENRAVPDPYYNDGFQEVFKLLDQATDNIIQEFT